MSKKKKQGHFCKICHSYKANEKFSGKGHRQHICKVCNRELKQEKRERKRANKKALEAGLRPIKKDYPKTACQAASYLQVDVTIFEDWCTKLDLVPCDMREDWPETVPLYDIDVMIAVHKSVRGE